MNKFPINKALEAAIVAEADEDTPRLAYADWLDENGDEARAEFIRVQCRLADLSPATPDWVDLIERQDELFARLNPRDRESHDLERDTRFYFDTDRSGNLAGPIHRGFPYFIDCQTSGADWNRQELERVVRELTRLIQTSTIRGLNLYSTPAEWLAELLAEPIIAKLTGLELIPYPVANDRDNALFFQAVADSPHVRGIKHLRLYGGSHGISQNAVAALTRAKSFGSVRQLRIEGLGASGPMIAKLVAAPWFRQLRHIHIGPGDRPIDVPMMTGLGRLPHLHTLILRYLHVDAVRPLAAGKFPSLARLNYAGQAGVRPMHSLARGRFPRLTVFESTQCYMATNAFLELLKAKWFGQLRVLDLSQNAIRDAGLKALAAHPVAKTLRVLRFGDNPIGKSSLAAIVKEGAFPNLTTLDLGSYHQRKGTPAEMAALLSALPLPRLRHLNLKGWPLGNAGAKALAESPTFANLTRLDLSNCQIGDSGAKALLASLHLQNLVELQLNANVIKTAADALAKPTLLPNLGVCELYGNKIPRKTANKLERARRLVITT